MKSQRPIVYLCGSVWSLLDEREMVRNENFVRKIESRRRRIVPIWMFGFGGFFVFIILGNIRFICKSNLSEPNEQKGNWNWSDWTTLFQPGENKLNMQNISKQGTGAPFTLIAWLLDPLKKTRWRPHNSSIYSFLYICMKGWKENFSKGVVG